MPRRYVAAAKPAASVVQPPPSATIVPRAVEAEVLPEAVERGERLRLLAERQLVRLREARAERELRVHAVDAGDVRVADERDRAVARDELAEPLQRAALDVDAGGREHDVVGVAHDRVGDLGVERTPLLVELARSRSRSCASGRSRALDSLPAVVEVDVDQQGRRAAGEARRACAPTAPRRRRARARAARSARARRRRSPPRRSGTALSPSAK